MSNLRLGSTPQLSEVYILLLKAVTYRLSRDSDVNRYCPTFSLLSFIATRLPDFILRKISVVKKENDGFLTPTSLLSFTRGHLKLKWWYSLLLTMQQAGLCDCPLTKRSSHQTMLPQMSLFPYVTRVLPHGRSDQVVLCFKPHCGFRNACIITSETALNHSYSFQAPKEKKCLSKTHSLWF